MREYRIARFTLPLTAYAVVCRLSGRAHLLPANKATGFSTHKTLMDFIVIAFLLVTSLVLIFFVLIIVCVAVFAMSARLYREAQMRHYPLAIREACIIGKRVEMMGFWTRYYVTFQFFYGNREELEVNGKEYGLLAKGDIGILHSQGNYYTGFDRLPRPR